MAPYVLSERIIESEETDLDFASMLPGHGHMHMNEMKTLFKVLEDVIIEPLGKDVLNFNSIKAYDFFINTKDTHKSWQTANFTLWDCFGTDQIVRY